MIELSAKKMLPNRYKDVTRGSQRATYIPLVMDVGGRWADLVEFPGMVVAVYEGGDIGDSVYSFMTSAQFDIFRDANPSPTTAWFFRYSENSKWEFVGFGESTDRLWEPGAYPAP